MRMRVVSAPKSDWRYEEPQDKGATCLLLTISGSLCKGRWYGKYNQYFIAWAPMPDGDREIEKRLREERRADGRY